MKTIMKGNAHKYGDNINTDVIIPSRYYWNSLVSEEGKRIARKYTMVDIDPEFVNRVKEGDIIVAGENFGCGSSRENAAISFVTLGISVIVAKSFAHIFYRNAINNGLPVIISAEAFDMINSGDLIEIDMKENKIRNISKGIEVASLPLQQKIEEILNEGGLINLARKKLNILH